MRDKTNINIHFEKINKFVMESNEFSFRIGNEQKWVEIYKNIEIKSVFLNANFINYQNEYCMGNNIDYLEISMIFEDENSRGIMPLRLIEVENEIMIDSYEEHILRTIQFENDENSRSNKSIKNLYKLIKNLKNLKYKYSCNGRPEKQNVEKYLSENLVENRFQEIFWLNLERNMDEIYSGFRKSYRPLIRKYLNDFTSSVYDKENCKDLDSVWQEFKDFHKELSGSSTRSDKSWDIQKKNIVIGEAILIKVSYNRDVFLNGFAYIDVNEYMGNYSVAAYPRNVSKIPVGHIAQYHVIRYLTETKRKWYRLGMFYNDKNCYDNKLIAISNFKKGFGAEAIKFTGFNKC